MIPKDVFSLFQPSPSSLSLSLDLSFLDAVLSPVSSSSSAGEESSAAGWRRGKIRDQNGDYSSKIFQKRMLNIGTATWLPIPP